jgi:hypothetical protein
MAQYIPKATVAAEIKRRIKEIPKNETDKRLRAVYGNEAFVLMELLSFLDTIKVKEVDLKKEIQMFSMGLAMKENNGDWEKDIAVTAKHFFELGMAVSNKAQKGE